MKESFKSSKASKTKIGYVYGFLSAVTVFFLIFFFTGGWLVPLLSLIGWIALILIVSIGIGFFVSNVLSFIFNFENGPASRKGEKDSKLVASTEKPPEKNKEKEEVTREDSKRTEEKKRPLEGATGSDTQRITSQIKTKSIKINLLMMGDAQVGKTSLIIRYLYDEFLNKRDQTSGIDMYETKTVTPMSSGQEVIFRFNDTPGRDNVRAIVKQCSAQCAKPNWGIILVYDVTNLESFENIAKVWVPLLIENCKGKPFPSITLVGNKQGEMKEAEGAKVVTTREGQALATKLGKDLRTPVSFYETNAKTDIKSAEEMFTGAALQILGEGPQKMRKKETESELDALQSLVKTNMKKSMGSFFSKSPTEEKKAYKMLCYIASLSSSEEQAKGIIALDYYISSNSENSETKFFGEKLKNIISQLQLQQSSFDVQYKRFVGSELEMVSVSDVRQTKEKAGMVVTTSLERVPKWLVGAVRFANKTASEELTGTERDARKLENSLHLL